MTYETNVRHHIRRKPKGGYGEVVRHQRTIKRPRGKNLGTFITPPTKKIRDDIVIVNPTPWKGGLFAKKKLGNNLMLRVYRFADDDYRVFAYRRDNNQGVDSWTESATTSFPRTGNEALRNLRSYKKVRDFTVLHPVLRDEGTSMSSGFNYKINGE